MKGEKNTASITQAANTDLRPSPPVAVAQFRERGNYFNIRDTSPYTATLVPSLQLSPQESFYTSDTEERRKRSRAASASFPSHTTPALRFYLACTIREQAVPGMHPVPCLLPLIARFSSCTRTSRSSAPQVPKLLFLLLNISMAPLIPSSFPPMIFHQLSCRSHYETAVLSAYLSPSAPFSPKGLPDHPSVIRACFWDSRNNSAYPEIQQTILLLWFPPFYMILKNPTTPSSNYSSPPAANHSSFEDGVSYHLSGP